MSTKVKAGLAGREANSESLRSSMTVQLVCSPIGCPEDQRATVRGLGLRRLHQTKELVDTPANRGMVTKVCHLVNIVEKKKG